MPAATSPHLETDAAKKLFAEHLIQYVPVGFDPARARRDGSQLQRL